MTDEPWGDAEATWGITPSPEAHHLILVLFAEGRCLTFAMPDQMITFVMTEEEAAELLMKHSFIRCFLLGGHACPVEFRLVRD